MSFTARFALALVAGVLAAIVIAPFAAATLAAGGFHFPFPRIFDRTVMATLLVAILVNVRGFRLGERLGRGFTRLGENIPRALRGLLIAAIAIAILWVPAAIIGGIPAGLAALGRIVKYAPAAVAIAIVEEGFFRAFLLDGMAEDFGERGALVASSLIYALAHVIRSPARFYVAGLAPMAGARNVAAALAQLAEPHMVLPAIVGLFLLGLVLGEAFILTGTVYFSLGMHAGLIIGLKSWPAMIAKRAALPGWLFGSGRFALVSGAAGWAVAIAILLALRPLVGSGSRGSAV